MKFINPIEDFHHIEEIDVDKLDPDDLQYYNEHFVAPSDDEDIIVVIIISCTEYYVLQCSEHRW